jgi:hypothetical protein
MVASYVLLKGQNWTLFAKAFFKWIFLFLKNFVPNYHVLKISNTFSFTHMDFIHFLFRISK